MENSIEEILNQSWSRVPSEIFIRLHWERPLQRQSIERDFRTLKRDRLVADIPMWDSCFFCSKGSDRQGRCRLRIAAGNDSRLSE